MVYPVGSYCTNIFNFISAASYINIIKCIRGDPNFSFRCIYTVFRQFVDTRVGTLIVATIYLQLIQNRYMFRSFTVLQCTSSHQHCVQPVASDVEVVGYL